MPFSEKQHVIFKTDKYKNPKQSIQTNKAGAHADFS